MCLKDEFSLLELVGIAGDLLEAGFQAASYLRLPRNVDEGSVIVDIECDHTRLARRTVPVDLFLKSCVFRAIIIRDLLLPLS